VAVLDGPGTMITLPAGVRILLCRGVTDMRRGLDGPSKMARDVLKDPFSGAIFCFRGRRGDLVQNSIRNSILLHVTSNEGGFDHPEPGTDVDVA
jgi:hypothetical protein